MHEKLKIYEEKMTKTLANLDGELAAREEPTPTC